MTDSRMTDDIASWQVRAEDEGAAARDIVDHNHNGSDARQANAAVAQVHATLAVAAEIRAFSLRLEETMLDLHVNWANRMDGISNE